MQWQGKNVVITGASRGIGSSLALELARRGARMVLTARGRPGLEAVAERTRSLGADTLVIAADVGAAGSATEVLTAAGNQLGGVDVLVNNAGVGLRAPVETLGREDLERTLAVNLLGPLAYIQAVLPHFSRRGGGLIINVSSLAGLMPVPYLGGYCASKHALVVLSRCLRAELREAGIRVMLVHPGAVETDFRHHSLGSPFPSVPRRSRVSAEQVAAAIARAAEEDREEVFVRPLDRLLLATARLLPRTRDRILLRRYGRTD
ncbi:MAG TPA: SDR family NAD(P)-dependent oxidoreductase [Bacillota bacterium]|nr:SDR family NAD(P)-dependent oxidoreductase [Bacillota bacterium]